MESGIPMGASAGAALHMPKRPEALRINTEGVSWGGILDLIEDRTGVIWVRRDNGVVFVLAAEATERDLHGTYMKRYYVAEPGRRPLSDDTVMRAVNGAELRAGESAAIRNVGGVWEVRAPRSVHLAIERAR